MPRQAHGGAFQSRGRFYMRVTVAPNERPAKLLPWAASLEQAHARAVATQALVTRLRAGEQTDFIEKLVESAAKADDAKMAALSRAVDGIVGGTLEKKPEPLAKGAAVTFRKFAERWTNGDLAKEYPDVVRAKRTADDDESRLEKHVYPVIGPHELVKVTLDDALEVMRRLPSELSPASRRHVAQLLSRIFAMAVFPCRLIESSPIPRGFLPKLRRSKAKSALWPDEETKLLGCKDVPLPSRMLYGFLVREGMRSSEALRMTWSDLDLRRGAVRLDRNKTDDPRAWALDPGTAEALRRWKELRGACPDDALVFADVLDRGHLADAVRAHLQLAGVTRPELFENSDARRQLRLHDLRASFCTVALGAGRTEAWVTARTGHRSSGQVATYRRLAQTFSEVGAGWFANMAITIPELAAAETAAVAAADDDDDGGDDENLVGASPVSRSGGTVDAADSKDGSACRDEAPPVASREVAATDVTDHDPSSRVLPAPAAGSELEDAGGTGLPQPLVSGLRTIVADLRAENQRLREELAATRGCSTSAKTRERP